MEGDIKVVKKQGPGTLLRFYLVFGTPTEAEPDTPRLSLPVELENAKVYISILENHQQNSLDILSSNYWLVPQEAVRGLTSWAGLTGLSGSALASHDRNCFNSSHLR